MESCNGLSAMTDKAEYNPLTWHPIRLPYNANTGERAFPKLNLFTNREPTDMRDWIAENCSGGWRHENVEGGNSVFWFEIQSEAMDFALKWFPYKCI